MTRGKKTKAKENNRKRASIVQKKNANLKKKKRLNNCPVVFVVRSVGFDPVYAVCIGPNGHPESANTDSVQEDVIKEVQNG